MCGRWHVSYGSRLSNKGIPLYYEQTLFFPSSSSSSFLRVMDDRTEETTLIIGSQTTASNDCSFSFNEVALCND